MSKLISVKSDQFATYSKSQTSRSDCIWCHHATNTFQWVYLINFLLLLSNGSKSLTPGIIKIAQVYQSAPKLSMDMIKWEQWELLFKMESWLKIQMTCCELSAELLFEIHISKMCTNMTGWLYNTLVLFNSRLFTGRVFFHNFPCSNPSVCPSPDSVVPIRNSTKATSNWCDYIFVSCEHEVAVSIQNWHWENEPPMCCHFSG